MTGNNNGKSKSIFPGMCQEKNPASLFFKDPKIIPGMQQPTGLGMIPRNVTKGSLTWNA